MKTKREVLEGLLNIVSDYFEVSLEELKSKQRLTHIRQARQVYMYLGKKYRIHSLQQVGALVNRDHSTVVHSFSAVIKDASVDPVLSADIREVEKRYNELLEEPHQKLLRLKEEAKNMEALKALNAYLERENHELRAINKKLKQCLYSQS